MRTFLLYVTRAIHIQKFDANLNFQSQLLRIPLRAIKKPIRIQRKTGRETTNHNQKLISKKRKTELEIRAEVCQTFNKILSVTIIKRRLIDSLLTGESQRKNFLLGPKLGLNNVRTAFTN